MEEKNNDDGQLQQVESPWAYLSSRWGVISVDKDVILGSRENDAAGVGVDPDNGNPEGGQPSGIARHSYLILEETYTGGSRLLGRIVNSVIEGIPNPSRTADNILETSLTPVELLDVLGFSGHRVAGVLSKNNMMVWTLEREYYS